MKKLIALFSILLASSSFASSVYPLIYPTQPATWLASPTASPVYYDADVVQTYCSASGFATTNTVRGICSYKHQNIGSVKTEFYNVTWDLTGNPTLGTQCGHTDSSSVSLTWLVSSACVVRPVTQKGTAVIITPLNTSAYYTATNTNGVELVYAFFDFLYTP